MALGGLGLGIANLGGIAGGLQQYQQRDAYLQAALQQLAMEQRRQRLFDQQQKAQAGFFAAAQDPALANLFGSPQTGAPGAVSGPDYSPGAIQAQALPTPLPQVPSYGANPMGAAGLGSARMTGPGGLIETTESGGRNVPNFRFDPTHTASGVAQITDTTWNRYAPQVGAPQLRYPASPMDRPIPEQRKVEQAVYDKEGAAPWANYNPALRSAMASLDGAQQQAAQQGAIRTATMLPPQMAGRLSLPQLAQIVQRTSPGASDEVKGAILAQLYDTLAPQARQQFEDEWRQFVFLQGEQDKAATRAETHSRDVATDEYRRARLAQAGGAGGEKLAIGKNYEVTNTETGAVRTVFGREEKGKAGIVDAMTGQPIQFDPKTETIKEVTASTAGGGRAGAQLQRQITAGAEVKADLQNVADMPVGTTTGIFGTQGIEHGLIGALKTDLGTHLTKEDETNMVQAMAGLGRELSTLMSPVYGGNWASEQLQPLIPREGYTVLNSLYGIARIKQSAINALQSLQPSPIVGAKQKEYARQLEDDINKAIPWSVNDVIAFQRQQNPAETFGQFAKSSGVSGASSQSAPQYKIGDIVTGKDGKQYVVKGFYPDGEPDVDPAATTAVPPR